MSTNEHGTEHVVATEALPFDWASSGNQFGSYSKDERAKLEQLYSETLSDIEEKKVVKGVITAINEGDVIVSVGYKCDGVLPKSEFRGFKDLNVGREVDVYIETKENKLGQLVLSRSKARMVTAWSTIYDALENDKVLEGYVKRRTKGGLIMDLDGIEAFLPGSQIDVKPIRDFDIFVGKTMEVKVVKINAQFENVVVSHKMLIEKDIEEQRSEIIKNLDKGQVLEGTIKNMTNFGVFIDLGGVDGLLHITDISWGRVNHPEEVLKYDQKVRVVVLDFDDDKNRISLGMKQLEPHPWDSLSADIKEGTIVKGKIVNVADYGAFLEIEPGVEGLIHVSEMSWSQHLRNPTDFIKEGDEMQAVVLTLDREERKMSLGIKQLTEDPWTKSNFVTKYEVGSTHKGIVRNLTNFGLFVELEEGVDGLVHVSDLSWTKKIKHPSEFIKVGEEIEVKVLEIDIENRKLALGHKQLEQNPWETLESVFPVGSTHQCTLVDSNDKFGILELPYGIEGIALPKQLKKQDGSKVKVGETLDFKVLEFNKGEKKIILSHTRVWEEPQAEEVAETTVSNSTSDEGAKDKKKKPAAGGNKSTAKLKEADKTTMGDIDALSNLKAQMENAEKPKAAAKPKKEEATESVEDKKYLNPETNRNIGYKKALEIGLIDEAGNFLK